MKPSKIWWFLVVLLSVILLVPSLFSVGEIDFRFFKLKIPQYSWFKPTPKPEYKDISRIIKLTTLLTDSSSKFPPPLKKTNNDSLKSIGIDTSAFRTDTLRSIIQNIEFPVGYDSLLFPLFRVFSAMPEQKKLIRILHYGDSQIEGDRITSYFRNQMQNRFGGDGIGMIPVVAISPSSISYVYDVSENWNRYAILNSAKNSGISNYGVLGSFSRFSNSSSLLKQDSEGWILLKYSNIPYSKASRFGLCKLIMGGNKSPVYIELKKKQTVLDADIYPANKELKIVEWKVDSGARNLMISFKGKDSPDLYAISLDSESGIAVDNIPLRGSSGLEFTRLFKSPYNTILKTLNVKFVILQFGVNAVHAMPHNIKGYEKSFRQQLKALRASDPQLPILVIGVSDLSQKSEKGYTTNEAVEKIRDAQKRAALESGCAFWDLYEAMGGKNSMPSWVFANPPLAQKDFTHFSPLGAKLVGEMFYRSLMAEYEKFLIQTSN